MWRLEEHRLVLWLRHCIRQQLEQGLPSKHTRRYKHVIICRFDVIITCLLRFVFARSNHDTTLRAPGLRNARATILTPSNTPAEAVTHYVGRPSVGMILTPPPPPPRLANIGESRPSLMSLPCTDADKMPVLYDIHILVLYTEITFMIFTKPYWFLIFDILLSIHMSSWNVIWLWIACCVKGCLLSIQFIELVPKICGTSPPVSRSNLLFRRWCLQNKI